MLVSLAFAVRCQAQSHPASRPALVSIRSVLERESGRKDGPVLLRGTITHTHDLIIMQDQTGAVELRTGHPHPLAIGDEAEVIATSLSDERGSVVQALSIQTLWHSSPPLPLAITPDRAADGRYNLHYVQTTGVLTRIDPQQKGIILSLQGDHQFFTARLEQDTIAGTGTFSMDKLEPGATMRLNGLLLASPAQYAGAEGGFVMLITSPEDMEMVHGPSWWNVRHASYLFAFALLLGVCIQVVHLQQVKRRYNAVLSERARIARDIHDTLAQGFAGIALQLEVVRTQLQEEHPAARHLNMALRMVKHSRAEAHQSIAALRAFSRDVPLQTMVEEMTRHLQDIPGQQLELTFAGANDTLLLPGVAENVYRIIQELVSNAQQHASASSISVHVSKADHALVVLVQDNGIGIEPHLLYSAPSGHFGLLGIRERVQTMRGTIQAERLHRGTSIRIEIPLQDGRLLRQQGVPLGPHSSRLGNLSSIQDRGRHA